jgi:predicted ATP-grasp superfamily ATP-dependent carboligase
MSQFVWEADPPELRAPILVAAFEGWFDVGGAATNALEWLTERGSSQHLASLDPDEFYDFTERRPLTYIEGGRREIAWPTVDVHALHLADSDRDLVVMVGVEPHLMWRSFVESVADVAERCDVALLVTLGAVLAEVPHTRPFSVTGSTGDLDLAEVLRLDPPSYQGPTGVVGVLHAHFQDRDTPAVSLRVAEPHYASGAPNPKASRALLERLERVTGLPTGWADLDAAADEWEARVNEAMNDDEDILEYVESLERRADALAARDMPSPDDLAAEFERFLRQQGRD